MRISVGGRKSDASADAAGEGASSSSRSAAGRGGPSSPPAAGLRKWRQPRLDDGTNVPLVAGGRDDELHVELRLSYCRDLLSSGDGAMDLLSGGDGAGGVGDAASKKFFCVAYAAMPTWALKKAKEEAGVGVNIDGESGDDGRDDVEEGDGDQDLPAECVELGRTHVISTDSADPTFTTAFATSLSYHMDRAHDVIVTVHDSEDQKLLGLATFRLERILRSSGLCESLPVESIGGSIVVHARTLDEHLVFCLAGKDLKKRGGSVIKTKKKARNPYIGIAYKGQDGGDEANRRMEDPSEEGEDSSSWKELWRSQVYRAESEHFGFGQFQVATVNGGDEDAPIRILAMDWNDEHQSYKVIGQADTTIREMLQSDELVVTKKGKRAGSLVALYVDKANVPNMAHYLRGDNACSLDLMVAVDFTNSNRGPGDPNAEESLHHLNSDGRLNDYESVLNAIGRTFQGYGSMRFSMWGFGAVTSGGSVDHRFDMGDDAGGACDGAVGLLSAYGSTVRSGITLSSPKLLRPIIDAAIERSTQNSQWKLSYGVLIVLCSDGKIGDLDEAMEKVSQASYVPLSIVFVGVGDGEFADLADMKQEGHGGILVSPSGNEYMRDMAHFVKFKEYWKSMEDFTHKLVEKIPSQLVQYHLSKGVFPPESKEESRKQSIPTTNTGSQEGSLSDEMTVKMANKNEEGKLLELDFTCTSVLS